MGCYTCGGNPNTWCNKCMPAEDTWVAPVDKLPDVFMGDRDHMYLLPNGDLFILSPDRTRWIKVNGTGNATAYDDAELKKRLTALEARPDKDTITTVRQGDRVTVTKDGNDYTVSANSIRTVNTTADGKEPLVTLTPSASGDTLTLNSSRLAQEIAKVQNKTDNFVSGVGVSREGNKVKLTYTFVDGTSKEVEFEDKDTVALAYDDTALKARVKALEDKPDRDNQTLSINGRTVSISNGNSIELPAEVVPKVYKAKGNGLFLDDDGTFHLEMARFIDTQYPYATGGSIFKDISSDKRTTIREDYGPTLDNQVYKINNDGTPKKNAVLEAGLLVDFTGSYKYGEVAHDFFSESVKLSVCSTNGTSVSGSASFIHPQEVKLEVGILAIWNDAGKVSFRFTPRVIWSVITESSTEHYTHFVTKEELESEEPIEIEVKKNEEVIGKLNMTIKNSKFFMQSVQGTILLKKPSDNQFYYVPRAN